MSHRISRFFSSILVGTGIAAMLPLSALAASFPILTPPPSGPVAVPTPDVQVLLAAKSPSPYRTFSYNGYSFEIPRTWRAAVQGDSAKTVVFTGADGKKAAGLTCPPLPFGLEFLDIAEYQRTVIKNGFRYDISLKVATPEGEKTPSFAYVSMEHAGYKSADKDWSVDPGYGCQLMIEKSGGLAATAKRIYRSVKVENWKTASAAGLTFRYPAAWSMKTADIAADWKHKDFSDANGRTVAEMDCPIPARGLEGFEGPTFDRGITRADGWFEAAWSPLVSTDESGDETHYLQNLTWFRSGPASQSMGPTDDSCVLYSPQSGQTGIFREIYKSLK